MNNPLFEFNPGDLLTQKLSDWGCNVGDDPGDRGFVLYVVLSTRRGPGTGRYRDKYHLYRLDNGHYFNVSVQWTHTYCVLAGK
jgi:hypothetical protein